MSVEIYYGPGSCAFAALVALEMAEVDYTPVKLDLSRGEQHSEGYLSINPRGRVPALRADGAVITESIAVLGYIASRYPEAKILPMDGPLQFAKAMEMLSWFSTTLHVHLAQVFRGGRFADDEGVIEQLREPGKQRYANAMIELNEIVRRSGTFLVGDRFSAVDAFALVLWRWGKRLETDTAILTELEAKVAQDMERPFVVRALAVEANGIR